MDLGRLSPIGALCILCHDADLVLPFYRDLLGFEPRRAEESFYHFARRGSATALCLWEIGHIARHTVFTAHPATHIPSKFTASLSMPSAADVDALHGNLAVEKVRLLSEPAERDQAYGFDFVDPCAVIWEVRASESSAKAGAVLALERITLLCRDMAATQAFYEDKLKFPAQRPLQGRVTYPAVKGMALSLWDIAAAAARLGLPDLAMQQAGWSAKTAMLAYSFDRLDQVQGLYRDLRETGVLFDHEPAHFDWDFNAAYFRDPEDNIWELFETPSNIEQRMLPQAG